MWALLAIPIMAVWIGVSIWLTRREAMRAWQPPALSIIRVERAPLRKLVWTIDEPEDVASHPCDVTWTACLVSGDIHVRYCPRCRQRIRLA
ncbi:MAG: hypothetical protein QM831_41540 [Kofleriaceae bacterium]